MVSTYTYILNRFLYCLFFVGVDEINEQCLQQGGNRKSLGLRLNLNKVMPVEYCIDTDLPLERQG